MKLEIKSGAMGSVHGVVNGVEFEQPGIQLDRGDLLLRMLGEMGIEVVQHYKFWDDAKGDYRHFSDSNINGRVYGQE